MYFDDFPKLPFDFPIKATGESQFVMVKDITENVRFKKDFLDGIKIYEQYKMKDGETIDNIAEKIYGSPDYHWILMLVNERFDYVEDFPLDAKKLDDAIALKYGNRKTDTKFYVNSNGDVVTPNVMITIDTSVSYINPNKTVQAINNAKLSQAQKKFGLSSLLLDGNSCAYTQSSSDFAYNKGDFTIQMYVYPHSFSAPQYLIDHRASETDTAVSMFIDARGRVQFCVNGLAKIVSDTSITIPHSLDLNSWNQVAISRRAGVVSMYVNDKAQKMTFTDNNSYAARSLYIGSDYTKSKGLDGYIDDLKISKGISYTSYPNFKAVRDVYTVLLLAFNGDDSSTKFIDEHADITLDQTSITALDQIKNSLSNNKKPILRKKTAVGYYTGYVNSINENNQLSVTMTVGNFNQNDKVEAHHYGNDAAGNLIETSLGSARVKSVVVPEGYIPVTNYDYEVLTNEKKRIIKIVPRQYVEQIMNEFKNLI